MSEIIIDNVDLSGIEKKLQYSFKNKLLLKESLRHSSYVNEHSEKEFCDNERLEFLGDAVVNLVVGHILMKNYPTLDEGDLSRMRANLVNEHHLAIIANSLNLGEYVLLGKGELQTNGREKPSILSDALEAVIAAVYLDGGYDEAFRVGKAHFLEYIDVVDSPVTMHNAKSSLQEYSQMEIKQMPSYTVIHESGPDHDKTFRVQLTVGSLYVVGEGKSKKSAEQNAAKKALKQICPEKDLYENL